MEYSESLELEIINKPAAQFLINEDNVKGKRTNKIFKIGKSFQYSSKLYSNRFLLWNSDNNILTFTEQSSDYELLGNQIEIEFQKSQILSVNVFETENDVHFVISTSLLVMRFSLHHPKKLRQPNSENFQYSIFYGITDLNEMRHCVTPYFNANEITAVNSIIDYNNHVAYFNYGLSNGNIYTFIIQESIYPESVNYFEMKESSLLSKLFSGIISRPKSYEYSDISILDMTYVEINEHIYVISVSRDNKLKIWSLQDRYCVGSEDLLPCVLESNNSDRTMSTINCNSIISSHKIKSYFMNSSIKIFPDTVVVYFHISLGKLSFSNWIMIQILDPRDKQNAKQPIQILTNINNAGNNLLLVDFEIGFNISKKDKIGIWCLVSDQNSNRNCSHSLDWIPLTDDDTEACSCRIYNSSNELDVHIENHQDTQEAIMNKIFTPGGLLRLAVVNILNKFLDSDSLLSSKASIDELKQNLSVIIESKVEKELISYLEHDEEMDVMELNRNQWYNILKEIVEEHYTLMEPMGIICVSGTIGISRKGTVSFMRCPNGLETILHSKSPTETHYRFYDQSHLVSGTTLMRYLNEFSQTIKSTDAWPSMEYQIFQLGRRPLDVTKAYLSLRFDIPVVVNSRLENQPEIIEKTVRLLEEIDIDMVQDMELEMEFCRLSSFSIGMLHYSICQTIHDRICLSIAMITLLMPRIANSSQADHLQNLISRLECLIKSLVSIYWLLTIRQKSSPELTDVQKGQLESLNLLENRCPDMIGTDILCLRVLQSVQNKFKMTYNHVNSWQSKMTEEMSMIVSYLHPNSEMFSLDQICKYFLSYNMPLELIEYLNFLTSSEPRGWWSGDESFVNVAIGLCYLLLDQPWKVVDCITDTICKLEIASSLLPAIIFNEEISRSITSLPVLQINLILKFIDIMENTVNPEPYLITMAQSGAKIAKDATEETEEISKQKSVLMTILFKNMLDIGRFDEARLAIMNNPDSNKQKDCLRQFIIVLSEKNLLDTLVQFDYGCLSEEFILIVHSRARASDLNNTNDRFYDVLYAFHNKNEEYKAAANCMLELALRLDEDLKNQGIYMSNNSAIEHLQMQVKSYLKCINITNSLPVEDQLFVFPASLSTCFSPEEAQQTIGRVNQQAIHNESSDDNMDISHVAIGQEEGTSRIIINLSQIKRQYNLIRCRLKVLRESPERGFIQSGKLTKSLTLTSLLQMGMYWDAIRICTDFEFGLESVVTTIATRCAQVSKNCLDRSWMKEKENIVDSLEQINREVDFASLGSLQKLLWKFLEELLTRYDKTPNGDLCIKACSKLLSGGIELLPAWLIDIVVDVKRASGTLLQLYISNGYLEPAITLTSRILDGQIDKLYFLRELSTEARYRDTVDRHQPDWVSYPVIFNLFEILEYMSDHNEPRAKDFYETLDEKMRLMVSLQQTYTVEAITQS